MSVLLSGLSPGCSISPEQHSTRHSQSSPVSSDMTDTICVWWISSCSLVSLSHTHTNTHIFTRSCQKAHREPLSFTANQFSANSFIDMTNVTSASLEQIWTSCVPIERRTEYIPALMIFVWYLNNQLTEQKPSQTLACVQYKHPNTDFGLDWQQWFLLMNIL